MSNLILCGRRRAETVEVATTQAECPQTHLVIEPNQNIWTVRFRRQIELSLNANSNKSNCNGNCELALATDCPRCARGSRLVARVPRHGSEDRPADDAIRPAASHLGQVVPIFPPSRLAGRASRRSRRYAPLLPRATGSGHLPWFFLQESELVISIQQRSDCESIAWVIHLLMAVVRHVFERLQAFEMNKRYKIWTDFPFEFDTIHGIRRTFCEQFDHWEAAPSL